MYSNNIQGWKTEDDLTWMFETAQKMSSILEIGCFRGRGTHALLSGHQVGLQEGKVVACDPFTQFHFGKPEKVAAKDDDIYREFLLNIGSFPNIEVWKFDAQEAMKMDRRFDMVFLDYRFTPEELAHWKSRADKMIAGYDYENFKDVIQSVLEEVKTQGLIWYKEL